MKLVGPGRTGELGPRADPADDAAAPPYAWSERQTAGPDRGHSHAPGPSASQTTPNCRRLAAVTCSKWESSRRRIMK
jgi:hypothetical protein